MAKKRNVHKTQKRKKKVGRELIYLLWIKADRIRRQRERSVRCRGGEKPIKKEVWKKRCDLCSRGTYRKKGSGDQEHASKSYPSMGRVCRALKKTTGLNTIQRDLPGNRAFRNRGPNSLGGEQGGGEDLSKKRKKKKRRICV